MAQAVDRQMLRRSCEPDSVRPSAIRRHPGQLGANRERVDTGPRDPGRAVQPRAPKRCSLTAPHAEPFNQSCKLRRPTSQQRSRGAILGADCFPLRYFLGLARSTSPARAWTAFAQSAKCRLAIARLSRARQHSGVECWPARRESPRAVNRSASPGGTLRRVTSRPPPRKRRCTLRRGVRCPPRGALHDLSV